MTSVSECPRWEYSDLPNSSEVLARTVASLLIDLRIGNLSTRSVATDTRQAHYRIFKDLTPEDFGYYAGHYRGENFTCLIQRYVHIASDPRVGYPPENVLHAMQLFSQEVANAIELLDQGNKIPNAHMPREQKIYVTVVTACRLFEKLLVIHPYLNGNGHMARLLLWAILGRYEFWPKSFSIEPRTKDPRYTSSIVKYRDGDKQPLEKFVLESIARRS